MRGAFISLEGIEGVGKSTNVAFTADTVRAAGYDVVTTREPGGTRLGESVRDWILNGDHGQLSAEIEALLMFAARARHLDEVIRPALAAGRWVVCDRFTDATFAYQGGGRGASRNLLDALRREVQKGLEPDLTLLLDAPLDVGARRIAERTPDHFEREQRPFFERVRASYLSLAAEHSRAHQVDRRCATARAGSAANRCASAGTRRPSPPVLMTSAIETLSRRLCPWLAPTLEQFETARRAGTLGHAWLISGPAGSGKLNLALVLARRLLGAGDSPTELDAAAALAALAARHDPLDRHPDLHWLHPEEEKETISVDQVRDVIDTFTLTAHRGGAKVAIVEPAEALTTAAANALLKTLEEPSRGSYLLLLSHQPGRLPATVRSRCQHLALRAPSTEKVATWLGVAPPVVAEVKRLVGAAPLKIAAAIHADDDQYIQ